MKDSLKAHMDSSLADLMPLAQQRGKLQRYSLESGAESASSWYITGLFLSRPDKGNLVCEALFLASQNLCILRVYCDSPLVVFYATKCSVESAYFSEAISAATRFFAEVVSQSPACSSLEMEEILDEESLPMELREALRLALYPIPPPVDLDEIPDAEPGDTPNTHSPSAQGVGGR